MQPVRQSFVPRLLAAVLDGVVLLVAGFAVGLIFSRSAYLLGVVSAAVAVGYMGLEIVRGQTIGKMLLGLHITDADGNPASPATLVKRYAIKNAASVLSLVAAIVGLNVIGLVGGIIGLAVFVGCFLVFRPDRLAAHDILAGTAVYGPAELTFALPKHGAAVQVTA